MDKEEKIKSITELYSYQLRAVTVLALMQGNLLKRLKANQQCDNYNVKFIRACFLLKKLQNRVFILMATPTPRFPPGASHSVMISDHMKPEVIYRPGIKKIFTLEEAFPITPAAWNALNNKPLQYSLRIPHSGIDRDGDFITGDALHKALRESVGKTFIAAEGLGTTLQITTVTPDVLNKSFTVTLSNRLARKLKKHYRKHPMKVYGLKSAKKAFNKRYEKTKNRIWIGPR